MKPKRRIECYVAGAMDGRSEKIVRHERGQIRIMLNDAFAGSRYDFIVNDPILKEKHRNATKLSMESCNLTPHQIFEMDLSDVERSEILYWSTGDVMSEGSEVEVAGAGWFNRWLAKSWLTPEGEARRKLMIIVSPKRAAKKLNKFQNMWAGVKVVRTHEEAIKVLQQHYKLPGYRARR